MELLRFGLGLAAVGTLLVIWGPTFAHGLWPYSERFTNSEKRKIEAAEVRVLILSGYWIVVVTNLALITPIYNRRALLLINAVGLPLVVGWHFFLRSHHNKKYGS